MFEKEAEEYVKKDGTKTEKLLNSVKLSLTREEATVLINAIKQSYIDGFRDGYNKANEWHYVKDGDLPKEEGEYLVIFESDGTKYKGLESYYPDTKEWSTICNIIAWKEIVLPELKESE